MKLARIEHSRCGEWDGYTHVLIPDDWGKTKFREVVDECVNELIKGAKMAQDALAGNPYKWRSYGGVPYKDFPDKTVKEINLWWSEEKERSLKWDKDNALAKSTLSELLKERGVMMLWEDEDCVSTIAYWGHHHGLHMDYSFPKEQKVRTEATEKQDW